MQALTPDGAQWQQRRRALTDGRLLLALDFDGTLVPIAPRPQDAIFDGDGRALLRALARRHDVAIVTGRALDDAQAKVGVDEVIYVGNHGFEIEGPGISHRRAADLPDLVDAAGEVARARLEGIAGITLESKGYSLSVHYRLVDPKVVPRVRAAVDAVLAAAPGLALHHGKGVFEVRPDRPWHKGSAVGYVLDHLDARAGPDARPRRMLALGDDLTDEDMFREVNRRGGLALRVVTDASVVRESAAHHVVHGPAAVRELLCTLT